MARYRTETFPHPNTGIPVCFVFDTSEELVWLEIDLASCVDISNVNTKYIQTLSLCEQFGQHTCASVPMANRIIKHQMPNVVSQGVCFIA